MSSGSVRQYFEIKACPAIQESGCGFQIKLRVINIFAVNHTGNKNAKLHKQLCKAMEPTAVSDVLKKVPKENCEDFFSKYSYDFVRLVHEHFHLNGRENEQKSVEYEVR